MIADISQFEALGNGNAGQGTMGVFNDEYRSHQATRSVEELYPGAGAYEMSERAKEQKRAQALQGLVDIYGEKVRDNKEVNDLLYKLTHLSKFLG